MSITHVEIFDQDQFIRVVDVPIGRNVLFIKQLLLANFGINLMAPQIVAYSLGNLIQDQFIITAEIDGIVFIDTAKSPLREFPPKYEALNYDAPKYEKFFVKPSDGSLFTDRMYFFDGMRPSRMRFRAFGFEAPDVGESASDDSGDTPVASDSEDEGIGRQFDLTFPFDFSYFPAPFFFDDIGPDPIFPPNTSSDTDTHEDSSDDSDNDRYEQSHHVILGNGFFNHLMRAFTGMHRVNLFPSGRLHIGHFDLDDGRPLPPPVNPEPIQQNPHAVENGHQDSQYNEDEERAIQRLMRSTGADRMTVIQVYEACSRDEIIARGCLDEMR